MSLSEDRDVKFIVCWSVADGGKVSEKKKKSILGRLFRNFGSRKSIGKHHGNFHYGKWIEYELKTI